LNGFCRCAGFFPAATIAPPQRNPNSGTLKEQMIHFLTVSPLRPAESTTLTVFLIDFKYSLSYAFRFTAKGGGSDSTVPGDSNLDR
jgi:hypothetical protein